VPEPVAVAEPEPVVVAPVPVVEPEPEPEPAPVPVEAVVVSEPEAVIHTTIELVDPDEPDAPAVAPAAPVVPAAPAAPAAPVAPAASAPAEPAVVVPMTRTVRIEVPAKSAPAAAVSRISNVERLLRIAAARGASSLFMASDSRPYMRVEGDMRQLEPEPVMTKAEVEGAILEISPGGEEPASRHADTEWITEFPELGRIRCTTFTDHRGRGLHLSLIATRAATAEQLGLPPEVQALATEPQGLVLIAGPRGNGKSTLMSALVDLVNRQRAEFVITLERQIRLVHDNRAAVVSQREIRGGADDAVAAARAALRENPGVLAVDDLASSHMVPLLLTAASEGLLVFVSMSAASSTEAVQRFIEMAAPEMRTAVQNAMAESFRGAVAQVLLKKTGGGLMPAREVLLATSAVGRVIADGQFAQLPVALESGGKYGMLSFTDALLAFVRSSTVDVREAFRKAPDRARLLAALKREGLDTTAVERLA
jgi:twitching motility protein PilT